MIEKHREPRKTRLRDKVIGILIIVASAVAGLIVFEALRWKVGSIDVSVIWLCLCFSLFFLLRPVLRMLFERRYRKAQVIRDELAARIAEGEQKNFFLYLRPFTLTGRLPITLRVSETRTFTRNYFSSPASRVTGGDNDTIDLKTELTRALEMCAPLVALGRPGEQVGAGRILTDEKTWQSVFLDLATRAIAIFVVPFTSQGTQWELDRLAESKSLRKKTIIIIPPSQFDSYGNPMSNPGMPVSNTERNVFSFSGRTQKTDSIESLIRYRILIKETECSQGLMMHFAPGSVRVPIVSYTPPATERGLLGWYLGQGSKLAFQRSSTQTMVLKLGLRNAIFTVAPELAGMRK